VEKNPEHLLRHSLLILNKTKMECFCCGIRQKEFQEENQKNVVLVKCNHCAMHTCCECILQNFRVKSAHEEKGGGLLLCCPHCKTCVISKLVSAQSSSANKDALLLISKHLGDATIGQERKLIKTSLRESVPYIVKRAVVHEAQNLKCESVIETNHASSDLMFNNMFRVRTMEEMTHKKRVVTSGLPLIKHAYEADVLFRLVGDAKKEIVGSYSEADDAKNVISLHCMMILFNRVVSGVIQKYALREEVTIASDDMLTRCVETFSIFYTLLAINNALNFSSLLILSTPSSTMGELFKDVDLIVDAMTTSSYEKNDLLLKIVESGNSSRVSSDPLFFVKFRIESFQTISLVFTTIPKSVWSAVSSLSRNRVYAIIPILLLFAANGHHRSSSSEHTINPIGGIIRNIVETTKHILSEGEGIAILNECIEKMDEVGKIAQALQLKSSPLSVVLPATTTAPSPIYRDFGGLICARCRDGRMQIEQHSASSSTNDDVATILRCALCEFVQCPKCLEEEEERGGSGHVCSDDLVKSVNLIKISTRPCPTCGMSIERISGCADMFCVNCKQTYDWNTLAIHRTGNSNPEFSHWLESTRLQLSSASALDEILVAANLFSPSLVTSQEDGFTNGQRIVYIMDYISASSNAVIGRNLHSRHLQLYTFIESVLTDLSALETGIYADCYKHVMHIRTARNEHRLKFVLGDITADQWEQWLRADAIFAYVCCRLLKAINAIVKRSIDKILDVLRECEEKIPSSSSSESSTDEQIQLVSTRFVIELVDYVYGVSAEFENFVDFFYPLSEEEEKQHYQRRVVLFPTASSSEFFDKNNTLVPKSICRSSNNMMTFQTFKILTVGGEEEDDVNT
jgi:hypothetical protein